MQGAIKKYYHLAKPGIIYGNLIAAAGGFLLATKLSFDPFVFIIMLLGLGMVIGSACVLNNYIDRDIDPRMERTKDRALVRGDISIFFALLYAALLGIVGFFLLAAFINVLAMETALFGFFFYVAVYTPLKRKTVLGTLIGSISGAVPPIVGYVAASGQIDGVGIILFLILVLWQMPHFYSIGIYRRDEYAAAGVPILPVVRGIRFTKIAIVAYVAVFVPASLTLFIIGEVGYVYAVVVGVLGVFWFIRGIRGFARKVDDAKWARRMFGTSLIVLMGLFILIPIDAAISLFI
jgi:protoheme IX farnesyltransferase